ncbi:MAG: acetyl-CoA carboxylase biotin carboxyl carrier protein subunit [Polyangiaceae bacterium]|nr:acetyl-CoA carboxylase biotin carboxyl carrier protein subunit [Polyangiaceae bacterium]
MKYFVSVDGTEFAVDITSNPDGSLSGSLCEPSTAADGSLRVFPRVQVAQIQGGSVVHVGNRPMEVFLEPARNGLRNAIVAGFRAPTTIQSERDRQLLVGNRQGRSGTGWLRSPMPGRIIKVTAKVGERVERGSALVIVEAMKMQNELFAEHAGVVGEVRVSAGDTVERDADLVRIDA